MSEYDDWNEDARIIEDLKSPRRPGQTWGGGECGGTGPSVNTTGQQFTIMYYIIYYIKAVHIQSLRV